MDRSLIERLVAHGLTHAEAMGMDPARARRALGVLDAGGISGGDGDEPTPREQIAELHRLLSDEEGYRSRLSADEITYLHDTLGRTPSEGMWGALRRGELADVDQHDRELLGQMVECIAALCVESGMRFEAAGSANAEIAELETQAFGAEGAAAAPEGTEAGAEGEGGEAAPEGGAPEGTETPPAGGEGGTETPPEGGAPAAGAEAGGAETPPEGAPAGAAEGVQAGGAGGPAPVAALTPPSLRELGGRPQAQRAPRVAVNERSLPGGMVRWLPTNELIDHGTFLNRCMEYPDSLSGHLPVGQKIYLGEIDLVDRDTVQKIDSRKDSAEEIARKLELACAGVDDPNMWDDHGRPSEALLASGGWNAPTPVDFSVPIIGDAELPVHNVSPSVVVDRGSLSWVRSPRLADIEVGGPTNTTSPIGIWTEDDDIAAAEGETPRKSVGEVGPWTPTTATIDALYRSLKEGVLQTKAFPEWVQAWEKLTEIAWARMAETYVLDKIEGSDITMGATKAKVAGAAVDYIAHVSLLAARRRHKERMAPDSPLRLLYPTWVEDLVIIDQLRAGRLDTPRVVARAWVQQQLRVVNVNAAPYRDSSTDGGQLLDAPEDGDVVDELPGTVRSYLYPEGSFVIGTNGSLRVGLIRDQDLVDSNDFRFFSETFEGVLDRGIWAYVYDTELAPSGTANFGTDLSAITGHEGS